MPTPPAARPRVVRPLAAIASIARASCVRASCVRASCVRASLLAGVALLARTGAAQSSPASSDGSAAVSPDERRALDGVLASVGADSEPGCALTVLRAGRPVYAGARGRASLATGAPITPRTPFYVGSVSKQFVAATAMLAVRDGRLRLADDVRRHFPELDRAATGGRPLTVAQLLGHTNGLREYESLRELAGHDLREPYGVADLLALVRRQRGGDFAPGEEHAYNNTGYFVLARVVERALGRPVGDVARTRIFAPLAMTRSAFRDGRAPDPSDLAVGYGRDSSGRWVPAGPRHTVVGAGGLLTTVEDLGRWLAAFDTTPGGAPLGLEEMVTPQRLANGLPTVYTAGLFAVALGARPVLQHYGAYLGYEAFVLHDPVDRVGVAVTCNRQGSAPYALAHRALRVLVGAAADGSGGYRPRSLVAPSTLAAFPPGAPPAPLLAALAGAYYAPRTGEVWWLSRDSTGALSVRGTGQGPTALRLQAPPEARFVSDEGAIELVAPRGADGGGALRVRRAWRPTVAADTFVRVARELSPAEVPAALDGAYASADAGARLVLTRASDGVRARVGDGASRRVHSAFEHATGIVLVLENDWVLLAPRGAIGRELRLSHAALRQLPFTRAAAAAP
jgi:CubicO group peptidase (beta-lactamase class C family)